MCAVMENNGSLKRGKCSLTFVSDAVLHTPVVVSVWINVNIFPYDWDQRQSAHSGLSALIQSGNSQVSRKILFIKCCCCTYCIWPEGRPGIVIILRSRLFLYQTNKLPSVRLWRGDKGLLHLTAVTVSFLAADGPKTRRDASSHKKKEREQEAEQNWHYAFAKLK